MWSYVCPKHLLDLVVHLCHNVHPNVSVEKGHSLARDHTRPVEIHVAGGNRAESVALDITDTSPLCSAILGKLCQQDREAPCRRPTSSTTMDSDAMQELGWSCIPLAKKTYDSLGKEALTPMSRLASHLTINS